MTLPNYFEWINGAHWFSTDGERVYGTLKVTPPLVTYIFSDGQNSYKESRSFRSDSAAVRFAARFAAEMRRADARNAVPHMGTFREFE